MGFRIEQRPNFHLLGCMWTWVQIYRFRPCGPMKQDILGYCARSTFLLKPKNLKAFSSSGNTSTWLRKIRNNIGRGFWRLCLLVWNTFPANAIVELLDIVVTYVSTWGLKREFFGQDMSPNCFKKFTKQVWVWKNGEAGNTVLRLWLLEAQKEKSWWRNHPNIF